MRILGGPLPILGTSGDDDLTGTASSDTFDVSQGGNDSIDGLAGDDTVLFGATYTNADTVSGGGDVDVIVLNGDYADLILFGANVDSIEQISLIGDFNYELTMFDDLLATGEEMNFDGGTLAVGRHFEIDAAGEVDAKYFVTGSSGDDSIATGGGNDEIFGGAGDDFIMPGVGPGKNIAEGGEGKDIFLYAGVEVMNPKDQLDGGSGKDILRLFGEYSDGLTFKAHTVRKIETVQLQGGGSFVIDISKLDFAATPALSVLGDNVGPNDTVNITAKGAVGNPNLTLHGGFGKDMLVGADGADIIAGNGGADAMTGGGGTDAFSYRHVSDSKGKAFDTINGFEALDDTINPVLQGDGGEQHVTGVDADVTTGSLTKATLNTDLEAAIGAEELAEDHAVLFTPDTGGFAGSLFLIIDGNNVAGYQANADIVILLDNAKHMNKFDLDNFGLPA